MEARGMSIDIPPDKLEAALDQLGAERERRLQAQIDSGEIVSTPMTIVVARGEDGEEVKARALANLPTTTPDGRAIHYDLLVVVTGVPRRDPDFGEPSVQTASSAGVTLSAPSKEPAGSGVSIAPSQPTYVRVIIRNGDEDGDPGQIAEAWYTIEDGALVLRDADDKHITSRALLKDDDPALLAKSLLRETENPKAFNDPIRYPKLGLA
jgi:hypothetical protein